MLVPPPPLRFVRIRRLHHALHLALSGPRLRGADLAATAGYCDQSHCVREFRGLLGEPPGAFLRRAS